MRREIMQPWGLVHGGVYAVDRRVARLVGDGDGGDRRAASWRWGMSNNTSFLRPISAGHDPRRSRRAATAGARRWVWDVDITDDEGRLCATSRVTVAVRPRRAREPGADAQPR